MKSPKAGLRTKADEKILRETEDFYALECEQMEIPSIRLVDSCELKRCTFETESSFGAMDTFFTTCDFNNMDLSNQSFYRCVFADCRMIGIDLHESVFRDCLFQKCRMDMANLSKADLKDCAFIDCQLSQASLMELKQKSLKMENCDLSEAELSGADLRDLDVSNCRLSGVIADLNCLKGLVVSDEQALMLSGLLGIRIKE